MNETAQNSSPKWIVVLKAILITCLAYATWQAVNYIVQYAAIYLFSLYAVRRNPSADSATLNQIVSDLFYRNISMLYLAAALLLAIILYLIERKIHFTHMININRRKLGGELVAASLAIGTFLGIFFNSFLNLIGERLPEKWMQENQESVDAFNGGSTFVALLATVIAAPIVEELLFRGFIYNALKKIMNTLPNHLNAISHRISIFLSALITSVLFGIYHGNILQALYAGIISFVMIWLYEQSGSLLANILFHGAFNFSGIFTAMASAAFGYKLTAVFSVIIALMLMVATGIACKRKNCADIDT